MSRIALVDDDRNILTSVQITLEAEGFDVETYADGQQALDALILKTLDVDYIVSAGFDGRHRTMLLDRQTGALHLRQCHTLCLYSKMFSG